MLTIVKEGNKNFQHKDPTYKDYGANDITIIFDGNIVKLRSFSGRVIFDKDGYGLSDVFVTDNTDGGSTSNYPNITSLKQRLINLGYPFAGGSDEVVLNSVDWGNINGNIENQADLIERLGGSQIFEATADQTEFIIIANPSSVKRVFTGRNKALQSEYSYLQGVTEGTLTFTVGRIVGTEIEVIY